MKVIPLHKAKNIHSTESSAWLFTMHYKWLRMLLSLFCVLIFWNCASVSYKKDTVALVDGELITRGDVEYALQIEHRREDLSKARKINISEYIQKIIDERLIIQEARRMGMENSDAVQKKINDFHLRESVVRLYREAIVNKVSVTEEEIRDKYKKDYESFNLRVIEVDSRREAEDIVGNLKKGAEFGDLAGKHSSHSSAENGGEMTLERKSLGFLDEVTSKLEPGEFSDVIDVKNKFYIVQLLSRKEADDIVPERIAAGIRGQMKSRKIKELENEYPQQLRVQLGLKIDQDLLAAVTEEAWSENREEWLADERGLVELNGASLTVGRFVAMLPSTKPKSVERALNNWIDRKVVDIEALNRHYEVNTDLKDMLNRYSSKVLIKEFIEQVLVPKIVITDQDLTDYYEANEKDFALPIYYKIQQLTVKDEDGAKRILNNLKDGANFTWLAKKESVDSYAQVGGTVGWVQKESLPEKGREIIDTLELGDISPVLQVESLYRIIRLVEKTGQEYERFKRVKAVVHKKVFRKKYNELYRKYVDELKKNADIRINKEEVEVFEKMFGK